jgi:hypothetical protein
MNIIKIPVLVMVHLKRHITLLIQREVILKAGEEMCSSVDRIRPNFQPHKPKYM